jgi:hypothetical protein
VDYIRGTAPKGGRVRHSHRFKACAPGEDESAASHGFRGSLPSGAPASEIVWPAVEIDSEVL